MRGSSKVMPSQAQDSLVTCKCLCSPLPKGQTFSVQALCSSHRSKVSSTRQRKAFRFSWVTAYFRKWMEIMGVAHHLKRIAPGIAPAMVCSNSRGLAKFCFYRASSAGHDGQGAAQCSIRCNHIFEQTSDSTNLLLVQNHVLHTSI